MTTLAATALAEDGDRPLLQIRRGEEGELPAEIAIGFLDLKRGFRATTAAARRLVAGSRRLDLRDTGAVLIRSAADGFAEAMLQDAWAGRETYGFALAGSAIALEPGDVAAIETPAGTKTLIVTRIEDGLLRRIEARSFDAAILASGAPEADDEVADEAGAERPAPAVAILDLPLLAADDVAWRPRIAAFADPWPGAVAVSVGTPGTGYVARQALTRRATMGVLTAPLGAGPVGRLDRANAITVRLHGGALASAPLAAVLNGANLAAIGSEADGWEVVQFGTATMLDAETWRLTGLLRGQAGTIDRTEAGHGEGATFVLLNAAVESLALAEAEAGLSLTARCGPAGATYDPDIFVDAAFAAARRGLMCLRPVHLRARRVAGGDVAIRFVRQTRTGGDAWEPAEVPLGETAEAYRVEILDGTAVRRTIEVATPEAVYAAAAQIADFGGLPASLALRVAQVSPTEGPGLSATATLAL